MDSKVNSSSTASNGKHVHISHINMGFEENLDEDDGTADSSSTLELENTVIEKHNVDRSLSSGNDIGKKMYDRNQEFEMFPIPKFQSNCSVSVRNATKSYGSGPLVLNNFNMSVEKGTIYSLLGASGCGKTTLLQCLVGIRNLHSGQILIFGAEPGTKESGIPGKRVGFMPQEITLYNEFSITEAIRYFGTLYGMPMSEINSRRQFLIELLNLPNASRIIGSLSGGQKRRVSLAVSLVHSPELLILDEPTVGVDPLLRESIWNHLSKLVSSQNTTVIITTHYIEETKQSHKVGILRGGRLLAEENPHHLLQQHNTIHLEEIVLEFCRNDGLADTSNNQIAKELKMTGVERNTEGNQAMRFTTTLEKEVESVSVQDAVEDYTTFRDSINRIRALTMKNIVVMTRNMIILVFMILAPAMQVFAVCIGIGKDPRPLNFGIVNHETNFSKACLLPRTHTGECDIETLSCQYLSKLPQDIVYFRGYDTEEIARDAVKAGHIWGFISFPESYSEHVYSRSASGNIVDNETLDGSQVMIQMDMSNKQISLPLKRIFYDGYKEFVMELLMDCGFLPEMGEHPVKYLSPIYGTDDTDFKEYVAPGILLIVLFFFPLCASGISYVRDKKQGTVERAMVAGVQTWEIILAFFLSEISIIVLQTALSFSIVFLLFGISMKGSLSLAVCLCILMGLAGISLGFMIASFCNEEIEAFMLSMAAFFPNYLLAGMIWPVEGMPGPIQYFSYLLPCRFTGESFRSIVSRGWGFSHKNVWPGFLSVFAWIIVCWSVAIWIQKTSSKRK